MATRIILIATLLVVGTFVGLAPAASAGPPIPPPLPPVCGEFYNWCDGLLDDVRALPHEPLCVKLGLCP